MKGEKITMFITVHSFDANVSVSVHASKDEAIQYSNRIVNETGFDANTESMLVFESEIGKEGEVVYNYELELASKYSEMSENEKEVAKAIERIYKKRICNNMSPENIEKHKERLLKVWEKNPLLKQFISSLYDDN